MKAAVLALALLAPVAAVADDAAPPNWSVGAGVLFIGDPLFPSVSSVSDVPFVQASLERRLGAATWLVVGVAGAVETDDSEPQRFVLLGSPDGGSSWGGRVAVGLRRELTSATAPLALSALVLADVGAVGADRRYLVFDVGIGEDVVVREESRGMLAGISAGAAVERQLAAGLSIRIASPLLVAGWSWTEVKPSPTSTLANGSARSVRTYRADVTVAPSLELRLAF
jgi:hypothetical protein